MFSVLRVVLVRIKMYHLTLETQDHVKHVQMVIFKTNPANHNACRGAIAVQVKGAKMILSIMLYMIYYAKYVTLQKISGMMLTTQVIVISTYRVHSAKDSLAMPAQTQALVRCVRTYIIQM